MADFMVLCYAELADELPETTSQKVQRAVPRQRGMGPDPYDREAAVATWRPA